MVGGFPKRRVPPPPVELPPVEFLKPDRPPVDDVPVDDDDKPVITKALVPAARPVPKLPPPPPPPPPIPQWPGPVRGIPGVRATRPTKPMGTSNGVPHRIPSENLTKLSRPAAKDVNGKPTTLNPDDIPY